MGNTSSTRLGDAYQASHGTSNLAEVRASLQLRQARFQYGLAQQANAATTPRAWLHQLGARNALVHAADQGNLALLKLICDSTEGRTFHGVNDGAFKSQAPLMRACTHGSARHTECVAYLLAHGADVYAQNARGDNALHIAAKNGNTGALHALLSFRPHADGEDGSQLLGDIVVQGDAGPTRFIDLHNGSGVTALHLAALKGSATAARELLRSGAAADAGTLAGVYTPQLSRGSTALHIAAARGHAGVVTALLDHQTGIPGMELQRLRNARGLKPSQLARLAGHHSVARLLSEVNISSAPQPYASAAAASSSAAPAEVPRRAARAALPARQDLGRLPAGSPERGGMSQEALLAALTQRARLLLSLRAATLDPDCKEEESSGDVSEEAALVAVSAEVAVALRRQGTGHAPADSSSTLLGLLSALADPSSTAAGQHHSTTNPPPGTSRRSSAEKAANDASAGTEESHARQQAKTAKSLAAGALVQAALNAMAVVSPGKEIPISSGFLAPASPLAAVIAVQAALKKLANQRIGSRLLTVPAGQVSTARGGAGLGTGPGMHRAPSGLSLRSSASTAGVLSGSNARGRRRRRMNAVRLGLSGSNMRHSATLEPPDPTSIATHVVSRRRRHRRNGSFGSMGYPAALTAHPSAQHPGNRGALATANFPAEHNAPESSAASPSKPGSSFDPEEPGPVQAEPPIQRDRVPADAAARPAQHDPSRASLGRGECAHPRDSAATELPEEWVTALHSLDSREAPSLPNNGTSEARTLSTGSGSRPAPDLQTRPCEGKSSLPCSPRDLGHRTGNSSDLLDKDVEPLLASSGNRSLRAGSSHGADSHPPAEAPCSQLQVRSRLFSTSEDAPLAAHPQLLASSPTNPFDTAEILGSHSIPSSPFGDSIADEWLHVHEGLLESGSAQHAWPAEDLFVRGSLLQGSDRTFTATEDSESLESRDVQWQSQDYIGVQALHDTIPIEGILPHQDSPVLSTLHLMLNHPLLESSDEFQSSRMPSVPLPGTAAAQVAEAFGRRTTFQRLPPDQPEQSASRMPAGSQSLPSSPRLASGNAASPGCTRKSSKEAHARNRAAILTAYPGQRSGGALDKENILERQTSVVPAPGAAAAEVRKAFAKIGSSSESSSAGNRSVRSGCSASSFMGAKTGTPGQAKQPASPASSTHGAHVPIIHQEQARTAGADEAITLNKVDTQTPASAAQDSKKPAHQASSDQEHSSDQPDTASLADLPTVGDIADEDSSSKEQQMHEQAALGRAMSLKGAAAADTARAFSHLRVRAGASAAIPVLPSQRASCPTSPDGKFTASSAHTGDTEPNVGLTDGVSEPESSFVLDLWGQQPETSTVWMDQHSPADNRPVMDLFPEPPAERMGRPVKPASTSLLEERSSAVAAEQPSIQRERTVSEDNEAPEALDNPGIAVPQSAFHRATPERADVSLEASGMTETPRQPKNAEAHNQMRLPHSRVDSRVTSPRKRASLGRRLSGLLPGVKGKERMRAAPVTKEMCFICMDSALEVSISGCQHSLCSQCAYQLCARGLAAPLCPFCRGTIQHFAAMPKSQPA